MEHQRQTPVQNYDVIRAVGRIAAFERAAEEGPALLVVGVEDGDGEDVELVGEGGDDDVLEMDATCAGSVDVGGQDVDCDDRVGGIGAADVGGFGRGGKGGGETLTDGLWEWFSFIEGNRC